MEPARTIGDLRRRVYETLGPRIAESCSVLGVPTHLNSGDHLIWAGERQFLKEIGCVPTYVASLKFTDVRKVPPGSQLLFQGGGNFGDVYRRHHERRLGLIRRLPHHPVLVFPQTVWFSDPENLRRSVEFVSSHPDMTLCARDRRSFDILQECFPKAHNLLVPDMAFCAPVPLRDSHRAGRILYLSRNDEGGSPAVKVLIPRHADVLDLPAERPFLVRQRYAFRLAVNRALLGAGRPLGLFRDRRYDAAGPLPYRSTDSYLRETAALVSSYEMVITERLHGHLLACMMGVPSILLDNNYGKCRSFHETWLTAIPGSYFAGSIGELEHLIRQLGI